MWCMLQLKWMWPKWTRTESCPKTEIVLLISSNHTWRSKGYYTLLSSTTAKNNGFFRLSHWSLKDAAMLLFFCNRECWFNWNVHSSYPASVPEKLGYLVFLLWENSGHLGCCDLSGFHDTIPPPALFRATILCSAMPEKVLGGGTVVRNHGSQNGCHSLATTKKEDSILDFGFKVLKDMHSHKYIQPIALLVELSIWI